MYTISKSSQDEMMDNIDSEELLIKLQDKYQLGGVKLDVKLKKVIRTPDDFNLLLQEFCMTAEEFFKLLAQSEPEVFTSKLIKFIRSEYLDKD